VDTYNVVANRINTIAGLSASLETLLISGPRFWTKCWNIDLDFAARLTALVCASFEVPGLFPGKYIVANLVGSKNWYLLRSSVTIGQ